MGSRGHGEPLKWQVERLANMIMAEIPGEPSQSEGAIDTAIRLLRAWRPKAARHAREDQEAGFAECETCRAMPGMPQLCRGCLHNRNLIENLKAAEPAAQNEREQIEQRRFWRLAFLAHAFFCKQCVCYAAPVERIAALDNERVSGMCDEGFKLALAAERSGS